MLISFFSWYLQDIKIKLGQTNFISAHLYLQYFVLYVTNSFLSMKFIELSSQMLNYWSILIVGISQDHHVCKVTVSRFLLRIYQSILTNDLSSQ